MASDVSERLFIGIYPGGVVYADRKRQEGGDYKRVAFLPYDTLELMVAPGSHPKALLDAVKRDAEKIAARRGELFVVSSSGQTVRLGRSSGTSVQVARFSDGGFVLHKAIDGRTSAWFDKQGRLLDVERRDTRGRYSSRISAETRAKLERLGRSYATSGHLDGVSVVTHLLAAGVGYGVARAVEQPEETRALAIQAGERLRAEGKRAYASAKTIAGRSAGERHGEDVAERLALLLRMNANAYHERKIDHVVFSETNRELWREVNRAGRDVHDRVLAMLRMQGRVSSIAFEPRPANDKLYRTRIEELLVEHHGYSREAAHELLSRSRTKTWANAAFRASQSALVFAADLAKTHAGRAKRGA